MNTYMVKQVQEVLVEFTGEVQADSAAEALAKARAGDVEWERGGHELYDADYVGDWEAWSVRGDKDALMDEHYHDISGNALVNEEDRCPVECE